MTKICKKGKVHPSPAPFPSIIRHLTLLPATILTLAAALSSEDKEVLAYLVSCSGSPTTTDKTTYKRSVGSCVGDHAPVFECNCFRCYLSFWARWDTSPNRQLIHEIIEAYEEGLYKEKGSLKKKKRGNSRKRVSDELKNGDKDKLGGLGSLEGMNCGGVSGEAENLEVGGGDEDGDKVELEKGSVRKIVSCLGERILGFLA